MSKPVRFSIVLAVAILYLHTWIGGRRAHEREMATFAARNYANAVRINREYVDRGERPIYKLRNVGPRSDVKWCFPFLPGVLYADSSFGVGPQYAAGGHKIVIYYGVGSFTLLNLGGWRA